MLYTSITVSWALNESMCIWTWTLSPATCESWVITPHWQSGKLQQNVSGGAPSSFGWGVGCQTRGTLAPAMLNFWENKIGQTQPKHFQKQMVQRRWKMIKRYSIQMMNRWWTDATRKEEGRYKNMVFLVLCRDDQFLSQRLKGLNIWVWILILRRRCWHSDLSRYTLLCIGIRWSWKGLTKKTKIGK